MKNSFSTIIANNEICNYFANSISSNSLSHAYILLGAKGTGKHTLARLVAAALNCENKLKNNEDLPCLICNSCQKIINGISPDILLIGRDDKATIGIDAVRFIKNDISTYPNDGDYKIYIIEDAHTMTKQAQNALLLTLEEPPSYAVFILLCENTDNILETIKSRAPILRMKTPSEEEAIDFLKKNNPQARNFILNSPEEFKQIYIASNGSIGRISELIGSTEKKNILQNRELALKLVKSIADHSLSRDFSEILAMFSQKRDERERLLTQLSEFESALRDIMVIKKSDSPKMIFFTDSQYAEELSYSFSIQQISNIMQNTEKAKSALMKNANVKLTITHYLSNLI